MEKSCSQYFHTLYLPKIQHIQRSEKVKHTQGINIKTERQCYAITFINRARLPYHTYMTSWLCFSAVVWNIQMGALGVSLLTLPEKHGLLLFNMSTLLLSEWLYQILTTQCRCWQAPRPQLIAANSHHGIHPKAYFVQLFCLLRPFVAAKTAERDRVYVSDGRKWQTDMMDRVRQRLS